MEPNTRATQMTREKTFSQFLLQHKMINTHRLIKGKAGGKPQAYVLTLTGVKMDKLPQRQSGGYSSGSSSMRCYLNVTFFYRQKSGAERAFFFGRTVNLTDLELKRSHGRDAGYACDDTKHLYFSTDFLQRGDIMNNVFIVVEMIQLVGQSGGKQKPISCGYLKHDLIDIIKNTQEVPKADVRRKTVNKDKPRYWLNLLKGSPRDLMTMAETEQEDSGGKIAFELRAHKPFDPLMKVIPHNNLVTQQD